MENLIRIVKNTPEDRNGTITDGARANAALPVRLLALQAKTLRARTSCDDERVSSLRLLILLELAPVAERAGGEVDF